MTTNAYPQANAKSSAQAIWSLVLGILSITCLWLLGSVPAIILGILALKKIGESGGALGGKGLAIGGIVTGGSGVILGLIPIGIIMSVTLPVTLKIKEKADTARQISDVRTLLVACKSWAIDHDGNYPPDLESLYPDYLESEEILTWPTREGVMGTYRYQPGHTLDSDPKMIVITAPEANSAGRIVVGYVSGIVVALTEEEYQGL